MVRAVTDRFFEQPILNSPYEYPSRHWELDGSGQPTQRIVERRRAASFVTPIPKAKQRGKRSDDGAEAQPIAFADAQGRSAGDQAYEATSAFLNDQRSEVSRVMTTYSDFVL